MGPNLCLLSGVQRLSVSQWLEINAVICHWCCQLGACGLSIVWRMSVLLGSIVRSSTVLVTCNYVVLFAPIHSLSANLIGPEGAVAIASAIEEMSNLQTLL